MIKVWKLRVVNSMRCRLKSGNVVGEFLMYHVHDLDIFIDNLISRVFVQMMNIYSKYLQELKKDLLDGDLLSRISNELQRYGWMNMQNMFINKIHVYGKKDFEVIR